MLLAGGLTPTNVASAVGLVHPLGVDVSSGVEQAGNAGHKDLLKVAAFVRTALQAHSDAERVTHRSH